MRGTKAKSNRRKATAPQRTGLLFNPEFVFGKGGAGKTFVSGMVAKEARTPRGTWKEFWQKKIRNISENNRLPRGFKEPKPFYVDHSAQMETRSWLNREYAFPAL